MRTLVEARLRVVVARKTTVTIVMIASMISVRMRATPRSERMGSIRALACEFFAPSRKIVPQPVVRALLRTRASSATREGACAPQHFPDAGLLQIIDTIGVDEIVNGH